MTSVPLQALSPLEVASNLVLGGRPRSIPAHSGSPLETLVNATLEAQSNGPCFVSFSGGRDSSLILAAALRAARANGLADPIPVTMRYLTDPAAEESEWQERVIAHLGVKEWIRLEVTEEMELLGPWATRGLKRHGLLWPANAYLHYPIFEQAMGGSVLTGFDGDGLFGGWRWKRASRLRLGLEPLKPKALPGLGHSLLPTPARRILRWVRSKPSLEWLREPGRSTVRRQWVNEKSDEPSRWDKRIHWWVGRRYLQMAQGALDKLASDYEVKVHHPFLDERFLSSLAGVGGARGLGARTDILLSQFKDLLPHDVLTRPTKATLRLAHLGPQTIAFMQGWSGEGVDESLVDIETLKTKWRGMERFGSTALLHQAWLSSEIS